MEGAGRVSFDRARDLCSSQGDGGERRFPCPYESYCPRGPHRPPAESAAAAAVPYAPVLNEHGYGVVRLASDDNDSLNVTDDVCKVRYSADASGSGDQRDKYSLSHVMCCRIP